jgi:hypothetical protein
VATFEITRKIDKLHLFRLLNILNSPPPNKSINTDHDSMFMSSPVRRGLALRMHLHMLHRLYRSHLEPL